MQLPTRRPSGRRLNDQDRFRKFGLGGQGVEKLLRAFRSLVGQAVALTDRGNVDPMRGSEGLLDITPQAGLAHFEGFENSTAVVVGYHDREVFRLRLIHPTQQSTDIVQKRDVAEQGDGARGANLVGTQRLRSDSHPHGLGNIAVDPGRSPRGIRIDAIKRQASQSDIPDWVRRADEHGVSDSQRVRDSGSNVEASKSV